MNQQLEEIQNRLNQHGSVTIKNSVGQKYYIEDYHEFDKSNNTYEANDEHGTTIRIRLDKITIVEASSVQ